MDVSGCGGWKTMAELGLPTEAEGRRLLVDMLVVVSSRRGYNDRDGEVSYAAFRLKERRGDTESVLLLALGYINTLGAHDKVWAGWRGVNA